MTDKLSFSHLKIIVIPSRKILSFPHLKIIVIPSRKKTVIPALGAGIYPLQHLQIKKNPQKHKLPRILLILPNSELDLIFISSRNKN
jgi:hypothetical protein